MALEDHKKNFGQAIANIFNENLPSSLPKKYRIQIEMANRELGGDLAQAIFEFITKGGCRLTIHAVELQNVMASGGKIDKNLIIR